MDWDKLILNERKKPYFMRIIEKVNSLPPEIICPDKELLFLPFGATPFSEVSVVLLGHTPYANGDDGGFAFSTKEGKNIGFRLKNIFKKIEQEFSEPCHQNGDLMRWARQGVLLLNSTMTAEIGSPSAHKRLHWRYFAAEVLKALNEDKKPKVFILLGESNGALDFLIDSPAHLVIKAPSETSIGFFEEDLKIFSSANAFLYEAGRDIIDWR